jgi:protein involved in polysaccharide export with SLBB domain
VDALAGTDAGRRAGLDSLGRVPPDSVRMLDEVREPDRGPPVFGREVFRRATSEFQPVRTGPVPPDYRVGPGDQLVVVLTGAVQQAWELRVNDEGWIVVPDAGRVFVSGQEIERLRETLRQRLSRSFSSLAGQDPATHLTVTLGQLRTNQVFVVGEVERPAAYTVSSLATVLSALYYAGGPTRNGSFRTIRVNRGGETVATLDLYDYLVDGRTSDDVRLEQGDVVFVPPAGSRVEIQGPVARPGIFGLQEGETLRDLLRYAGGVQADAELARVQIRRILAPDQRRPGRDRAVLDVPVGDLEAEGAAPVALRDGDRVSVFAVLDEARNEVQLSGAVWRPGTYGVDEDTRLWDLIDRAGGLRPDALRGRAQIQRLQADYTRRMIPVSLATGPDDQPAENPRIEGMDQVMVFARRELREDMAVSIGGWVREPGVYPFSDGMTVADLVLQAGGLRTGVYVDSAEVARLIVSQARSDTLTRRYTVSLDSTLVFEGREGARSFYRSLAEEAGPVTPAGDSGAYGFELQNLDAVYVRRSPGFEPQRRVVLTGEVRFPGPYSIQTREERISDLIRRAGGLTDQAYAAGFQLWRESDLGQEEPDTLTALQFAARAQAVGDIVGRDTLPEGRARGGPEAVADSALRARARLTSGGPAPEALGPAGRTRVGVDLVRAMERPGADADMLVEPGDSLHVPGYQPTVAVRGAVTVPTLVQWREGAGADYYIDQAGGYAPDADEGRARVQFANGEVATRGGSFLFFGGGLPDPDPGSTVTVPFEPPEPPGQGISTGQLVTILTSVLGSITTIIVATN